MSGAGNGNGGGKGRNGKKGDRAKRRGAARLAVVQALYQMDIAGTDLATTVTQFELHRLGATIDDMRLHDADEAFFRDLLTGVVSDQLRIDRTVNETLKEGWPLARVDSILRAVLRAGGYELFNREDVPARVAINEYVEVAKAFFDGDEVGIVNGVLDRVGRIARPAEFGGEG